MQKRRKGCCFIKRTLKRDDIKCRNEKNTQNVIGMFLRAGIDMKSIDEM